MKRTKTGLRKKSIWKAAVNLDAEVAEDVNSDANVAEEVIKGAGEAL